MNGTWILDARGQRYDLTGVGATLAEPSLDAMAHACAQIVRFNGHCKRPYSVAEHQLLCAHIAFDLGHPRLVQLACLTHDLHEAYVGEVVSPLKWAMGDAWAAIEHPHTVRVRKHLGLETVFTAHRSTIKRIDLIALATERHNLLPWDPDTCDPWPLLDTPGSEVEPHWEIDLDTATRLVMTWEQWRDLYLETYHDLRRQAVLEVQQ